MAVHYSTYDWVASELVVRKKAKQKKKQNFRTAIYLLRDAFQNFPERLRMRSVEHTSSAEGLKYVIVMAVKLRVIK